MSRFFVSTAALTIACFCTFTGRSIAEEPAAQPETNSVDTIANAILGNPEDDKPAIRINGKDVMTIAQFNRILDSQLARLGGQVKPEDIAKIRPQIRTRLIQEIVNASLVEEVAKADPKPVTDDDRLKLLTEQFQGMVTNVQQFVQMATANGMDEKMALDNLDRQVRTERIFVAQTNGIPAVTEAEAKTRFDEIVKANPDAVKKPELVTASHILVRVEKDADEATKNAAKEKIEKVRKELLEGGDFAKLAQEYSDCPSKANGGSLGEFGRGRMVPEFEKAAFEQKVGEIGEIVETDFGYHVVKVEKHDPAGTVTFEEVRDEIIEGMGRERIGEKIRTYLDGLRAAAKIEILADEVVSQPVAVPSATDKKDEEELPAWAL
ncbi:MAG: peptidylprolyl isomerase [Kiritimatiellia bacterium]